MAKKSSRAKCLDALQKLVRLKAADDNGYCTCVTCGCVRKWNEGMQGGHFLAKGSSSRWALVEENVHPQCKHCNAFGMNGGAAAANYTIYMIDMYGRELVENMIETKSETLKISAADYRDMLEDLNKQIKYQLNRVGS